MPQESAGCARVRKPALAILVCLVLMLLAHVVACAMHPADGHGHALATSPTHHEVAGSGIPQIVPDAIACFEIHGADEHPGHGPACCDPADWPADVRVTAGTLLLALLLLALIRLRHRAGDPVTSGAPPGRGDTTGASAPAGLHLLRLVCVSRT
ncbi:hypothetical protein [Streptomyces himalayensis]|uniref:Uncharacterized protein n=1 Tax=Streptomyces himalayensis subsp. himalayensis TaxID=2756131 RepID=A0A7W0DPI3_9ACTN|nr:hypothetical protein [Streptomyces himalayensis]MBA2948884.1 hypothetical protein [Streptomyces himalayensis subsp. himalayensis]